MTRRLQRLTVTVGSTSAAAAAVLLLAGCVSADSVTSEPPSATVHPTTASATSVRAVAVTYRQTGGEEGMTEMHRFAAGKPAPAGFSRVEANAALQAASDPALRSLETTPLPDDQCCDRYLYVVTITWADGTSRTYETLSGVEQPAAFDRLLDDLS